MEALRQLNKKLKKEGKTEYEGYVYLPLISEYDVPHVVERGQFSNEPLGRYGLGDTTPFATAKEKRYIN